MKKKSLKKIVDIMFITACIVIIMNIALSFLINKSLTPENLGNYIVISWTINGICLLAIIIKAYTNITGNPGMATAGSGDVLAGIIAGLMGQNLNAECILDAERINPADAAKCGVFIHGLAGDIAAETVGEYGLIATDIAYYTAIAIKGLSD